MTTPSQRHALALSLITLLTACGGSEPENASTADVAASPNLVLLNDSRALELQGAFSSVEGYLSQSKKVLRSESGQAQAAFNLSVPRKGYYELFTWAPQSVEGAGGATVSVHHKGGRVDVTVDQSRLTRQWNSLGVFEFDTSTAGRAVFRSSGQSPVLIDAVRLQFLGEERPAVSFRSQALPIALTEQRYETSLEGQGGTAPYQYLIEDGKLPAGLVLDTKTGVISGIPAYKGQFSFSAKVIDAKGVVATTTLAIDVISNLQPVPTETPSSAQLGAAGKVRRLASGTGDVSALLSTISTLPEGRWSKVNLNAYSDVWTPADLRPLYGWGNPTPDRIIAAWSSFAWDSNRATLVLYGGGHANYRGNDVYLWRAATQRWERGALPSESAQDSLGNWNAIDGPDRAPASAHTYDNTIYLPLVDRTLVLGGAAEPNGGHYLRPASETMNRKTGPYLFNTSLAHPDKVGGTTGSHVKRVAAYPSVVGGNMWSNRDNFLNLTGPYAPPSEAFVDSCTGYTQEGGKDVTLLRTTSGLYKYTLNDLANPSADRWDKVGTYWGGPGSKATCAYDQDRKVFVRTATNDTPFVYWDLNTPGPNNKDVSMTPVDPTGEFASLLASRAISIADCALEFDPQRKNFKLWCGDGRVWALTPPSTLSPSGWTIVKQPSPALPVPNGDVGTGILGKWKYVVNFDVFMGLQDSVQGNIWIYKPIGWRDPSGASPNVPPTVSLTRPRALEVFSWGAPISLTADAVDSDGSIARVEFFNNDIKIGEATAAPFTIVWSGAPAGALNLRAVATDNRGGQTASSIIPVTVSSGPSTEVEVVLQRGPSGGALVTDTYLSTYHRDLGFGGQSLIQDLSSNYSMLVRFPIFQSEGGPVPSGATIVSAKMALYKYTSYNMTYAAHRSLKPWNEKTANWNQAQAGSAWSVAGGNGTGSDFDATADAIATTTFDPGWVVFDLTAAVQRMSSSPALGNYGWRLRGQSGYVSALKRFYSSEYLADPSLRPKLTVKYR